MKQERNDRCGSYSLTEVCDLEKNYRETTVEELEGFLFSLQRLKDEGQDMDDWIDITEQAIRIKVEDNLDAHARTNYKRG